MTGGILTFSSFQPNAGTPSDECSANVGASRDFNMNILDTAAALDWDEDGTLEPLTDRTRSGGSGISSEGVPVYTTEGVLILKTSGSGITSDLVVGQVPRFRTYWHDDL